MSSVFYEDNTPGSIYAHEHHYITVNKHFCYSKGLAAYWGDERYPADYYLGYLNGGGLGREISTLSPRRR